MRWTLLLGASAAVFALTGPVTARAAPPEAGQPEAAPPLAGAAPWTNPALPPDRRAELLLDRMSLDEQVSLLHGQFPALMNPLPEGLQRSAGYVPGLPQYGVPALYESDASLGVANATRENDDAAALPSGLAIASTFSPDLAFEGGAMIGKEARQKGFNVMLAGGVNLARDPRNGRNFEYLGEDPLLAGTLDGAAIRGIQSQHVVSTAKHYALNDQETGRQILDARIGEAAFRESDLLAFELALETGNPGSVMCAYNQVNGAFACENHELLTNVLRRDWKWKGWTMSDWGAVHSLGAATAGLDQESAGTIDPQVFFDAPLKAIKARAGGAEVTYSDGADPAAAAALARDADVVVVFASQWATEGMDVSLTLPSGQDQLIEQVAAANPHTVVVLETGGPVFMPWLDKVGAALEAWYPGAQGGEAIARVLYGEVNPSGRLPVTFPANLDQLPHPKLPGEGAPEGFTVNYAEGSDVGYRWFAKTGHKPLFPFGYGLSYSGFRHDRLKVSGGRTLTVSFRVTNIGDRAGIDTPQVYLTSSPGRTQQRLIGWSRTALRPGESRQVTVTADRRLLADWDEKAHGWRLAGGTYRLFVGADAASPALRGAGTVIAARLAP